MTFWNRCIGRWLRQANVSWSASACPLLCGPQKHLPPTFNRKYFSPVRPHVCTSRAVSQKVHRRAPGCYKLRKKYIEAWQMFPISLLSGFIALYFARWRLTSWTLNNHGADWCIGGHEQQSSFHWGAFSIHSYLNASVFYQVHSWQQVFQFVQVKCIAFVQNIYNL